MGELNKAHFISDIHGYVDGLELADKICTQEEPLYILGDLFDHKYGDEKKIIDLILKMIDEQRCHLIMGNHDEVLYLIFFRILDDQTLVNELSHKSLSKVTKIFMTLFDKQFYDKYILIINKFNINQNLDEYYQDINKLVSCQKYQTTYQKIKRMYETSNRYLSIKIGSKRLLLNHCGSNQRPDNIEVVTNKYQKPAEYDYIVMGHLTIPYVEEFISGIDDAIEFSNFTLNSNVEGLTISNTMLYNSVNKAIMIDDGSHVNLVTITT